MSHLKFDEPGAPADPREGVLEAGVFVAEVVLALGLAMRLTAHLVGTRALTGETVAEDRIRYGLTVGFSVREPQLSARQQFEIGSVTAGFAGAWWATLLTQAEWGGGLALVLIANAAVLIGDPLWIRLGQ